MVSRPYKYRYTNPFNTDDMDRRRDSIHSVPFWIGLLLIVGFCGLFIIVFFVDGILPKVLRISDEENYPNSFITERATNDLKFLTDLGPRVIGSIENEYITVDFLTRKITTIITEADSSQYLEMDIQIATGGYFLNASGGYLNVYDKVQNVIVKMHGSNNESNPAVLVNAHFDSVATSPGGSDDGINVANMLEVLRKLSKSDKRLESNVIFLFNGAEEAGLLASHGYITHHRWGKESKVVINLESAGTGGKLILFQTGPQTPWLLNYYSQVPHPYGSVAAEELFQSGVIPSDTDFRIFRDFGNVIGFDMAYYRDGHRYHTKYDGFSNIPLGSYQHGGNNILALIKGVANAPELTEQHASTENPVFFDVFGWFMINYDNSTAVILNWATVALSIAVFFISICTFRAGMKGSLKFFLFTVLAIILSWIIAAAVVLVWGFVLDLLNKSMSWYGRVWLIFGLYMVPVIAFSGCLMFITNHKNLSLGIRSQLQAHLVRLIWTVILALGTILGLRSIYVVMILVLFSSVGFLIISILRLHHTVRTWQIIHLSSLVIPIAYILQQFWSTLLSLVPITGRMGSTTNPEIYIGLISFLYTLLATSSLTALTNLLKKPLWYYLSLLAVFALFVGLLFTPIGFPYSGNENAPTPQRQWMMHSQRKFFNERFALTKVDAGVLMSNMDRNSQSALMPYVKELSNASSLEEDCSRYTLCALPLIQGKMLSKINDSTWIPFSQPVFPENETLTVRVVSKIPLSSTQLKLTIRVSGPDRLNFFITPRPNVALVNTSFTDTITASSYTFENRPVYVILYQLGKADGIPLTFDLVLETPENHVGSVIDFAVSAVYVHASRVRPTTDYTKFLSQFPDWADVISYLAAYQSYVI